jgi:hypothetical protein
VGNRSIRIEVWAKDDRKIRTVSVGKTGFEVSGKGRAAPKELKCDYLTRQIWRGESLTERHRRALNRSRE